MFTICNGFYFWQTLSNSTLFKSSNPPETKSKCIDIQNYKGTGEPFEIIIKQEPSNAHFVIEKESIKPTWATDEWAIELS